MRFLAALGLALAATPAAADYVYDPADLPAKFQCDTDRSAEPCEEQRRFEAWHNRYGDLYDLWHDRMLLDTNIFFGEAKPLPAAAHEDAERNDDYQTPNMVDAVYRIALRRYSAGWAFAVDMVCAGAADDTADCTPKLRMVRFRTRGEIAPEVHEQYKTFMPTSPAEAAQEFAITAKWEEADLRTCPGAMRQLLRFPAQLGNSFWHPGYVRSLKGETVAAPKELFFTVDGSGVLVRARSKPDPSNGNLAAGGGYAIYQQWNGGEGMAWALDMAEVVRPCLKPAPGPAPWEKVVAAQHG